MTRNYSEPATVKHPVDYEVAHHYTSTHPRSPFVQRPVVMRLEPGLSRKLVGGELSEERPDGTAESTEIAPNELGAALSGLGVELTPDELAALVRHEQHRNEQGRPERGGPAD
ncbi:hypothetical protein GIY23_20470 [Allosaccharopolyspora coralli]|uniref:Uncharacterized protein n=1 Tax=Allosaccharopolyspora coralli TaxID=2665642 RepID=A0A5Q3QEC9_9PSEU|nr:arylamine N-acetyltransferase [Allosaccharopolyspora coralli]QGK71574.1 hypothetical protein GIY23_20470 [Allosaccharopolyspora coralli]